MTWKEAYAAAYKKHNTEKFPEAMATGYFRVTYPKVLTANGLTTFIMNYLTWHGHRSTRISSAGRYIAGLGYIPGPTRVGSADVSATIRGRSVMLEVKVGRDKPSPDQLKEQARERAAGGIYEFVYSPDGFLLLYNSLI